MGRTANQWVNWTISELTKHQHHRVAIGRAHTSTRLNSLCLVSQDCRTWIPTWTKIESACSCHLTNSSTYFCQSSSTSFWNIMLYIVFEPSLKGEETLEKLKRSPIQIRIQIFTRIERNLPCLIPNRFTKFCPNPSATFWDFMLCIVFGPISQWWRITSKILVSWSGSDPHQNLNTSSTSHTQHVH